MYRLIIGLKWKRILTGKKKLSIPHYRDTYYAPLPLTLSMSLLPDTMHTHFHWYYPFPWYFLCPFPPTLSMSISHDTIHACFSWHYPFPITLILLMPLSPWHYPCPFHLTLSPGSLTHCKKWYPSLFFSLKMSPFFVAKHWLFNSKQPIFRNKTLTFQSKMNPIFYGKTLTFQIKWTFLFTVKHWTSKLTCFSPNSQN